MLNQTKCCLLLLIPYFICSLISCDKSSNISQPPNQSQQTVDWKAYLSRPFLSIEINRGSISAFPYMSSFDTATLIDSITLEFAAQDSVLLIDSSWYNCKDRNDLSCYGVPIFYRQDTAANYPHFVVARYRLNKSVYLLDTIQINPAINFIKSTNYSKTIIDTNTFLYNTTWNISTVDSYYGPYMAIALDNGLAGAEYYQSYPNYDNLPETPQPPEGYQTMYARFSPEDNAFSFHSRQNRAPFIHLYYTTKKYSNFDVRVSAAVN